MTLHDPVQGPSHCACFIHAQYSSFVVKRNLEQLRVANDVCRERSYFVGRFSKVPGKIISYREIFHSACKYMIFSGTFETACKN
jgi:hypothetical protein